MRLSLFQSLQVVLGLAREAGAGPIMAIATVVQRGNLIQALNEKGQTLFNPAGRFGTQ
jgi:hypothetical protein